MSASGPAHGGLNDPGTAGERILIVEDDPITARYLDLGVRRMGYTQVVAANSSAAALAMAQATSCDLVLMDIQIDGRHDGIETARLLRERYDMPVIFLTALADEATMRRARELNPLGYLVKPVKAEDLRTTLAAGLHKQRLARATQERGHWFDAVLELHREAVLACGNDGLIVFANSAARRMLGLPEAGPLPLTLGQAATLCDAHGARFEDAGMLPAGETMARLESEGVSQRVRITLQRVADGRGRPLGNLVKIERSGSE